MPHLILASGSPRRQAFLSALGLSFTIDAADVDETAHPGEAPTALVERLSRLKASEVAVRHDGAIVLAADTIVVLEGQILGKPSDPDEAVRMLKALRGRVHQVYTAVSLACTAEIAAAVPEARTPVGLFDDCAGKQGHLSSRLCRSNVWMRHYSDNEIERYVASGDPLDKAGAYAIQHPFFSPVSRWEGCYASIMGLPLGLAVELLRGAGLTVPVDTVAVCERTSGSGECCLRGPADRCG